MTAPAPRTRPIFPELGEALEAYWTFCRDWLYGEVEWYGQVKSRLAHWTDADNLAAWVPAFDEEPRP